MISSTTLFIFIGLVVQFVPAQHRFRFFDFDTFN